MLAFFIATHLIITTILIFLIVISRPSTSATSGIGANISNIGTVSANKPFSFSSKLIIYLAILFFCNSLVLALLNYRNNSIKINIPEQYLRDNENADEEKNSIPDDVPVMHME